MIIKKQNTVDINLVGEDVKQLQSALIKVIDNGKKIGFTNAGFTKEEEKIITDLSNELNK